jgi:hypothetical protein
MRKIIFKFMKIRKREILPLILILIVFVTSCENRSIFTELSTNRLTVIIKGTYESSGTPKDWLTLSPNSSASGGMMDDSVDDYSTATDVAPTTLMLDIAELRLDDKKFANYRQLISASLDDSDPFFNGQGITLENDDPVDDRNYSYLKIYIRKLLFDSAYRYLYGSSGWEYVEEVEDIYNENTVNAYNINRFQVNTYYDSLRLEADYINRVFPLQVEIPAGMYYSKNYEQAVLEVRLVFKNFIKKYEYDYYSDDVHYLIHFYGLSDWLRDVQGGETAIGGNLHSVARFYVPSMVGSITGTSPASDGYIIAIPADDSIDDYNIDLSGISRGGGICDFPQLPSDPTDYIEPWMDYYLKYEKYKVDWQDAISSCSDSDTYEQEWEDYESAVTSYKIPPLSVWSAAGSTYTLDNVMPGDYKVYHLAGTPDYGDLPYDASPTYMNSGSEVTVTANETVTVNE